MKLSFSLPRKSKSKSKSGITPISDKKDAADGNNLKKFVTEFDPSETLTNAKPNYVIPPVENRRRPHNHKETKNIYLPLQSASGLEFEAEIPSGDGHVSDKITYGLNLRQKAEDSRAEAVEQMLPKSMRNDLKSLPDAPELDDFESVPVEGFGAALLAGYGWKPGQGIGLRAKEDVQIVEYKKWTGNEGFGFDPDKARVKVVEKLGSGRQEELKVDKLKIASKRSREIEKESSTQVRACKKNYRGRTKESGSWLRSHIRVRIISKDLKGGRLYLKKAVVTDVVGPTTCDITMDETQELVQRIDQELLETALPRRGGPVLVLSGTHKGVYGNLVEKDLDKETGVVCDADNHEMLNVKLEQVAEYLGNPADIEY